MQNIYETILEGIDGGNYNILEELIKENTDNKKLLYYSCLLYEQKKEYRENPKNKAKHKKQWIKEMYNSKAYNNLLEKCKEIDYAQEYFLGMHIECTTYCCAKCTTCTHEQLILNGDRKALNISYEDACYRIRKMKLMFLLMKGRGKKVLIDPVGLGEPLCHPKMMEIIEYMVLFFGSKAVWLSTNAYLLNKEVAQKLIQLNLSEIVLSLSYFNKEIYEKQIGMDYDRVIENISYFMKIKKESNCTTKIIIHIFDNELNTDETKNEFFNYFKPMLNHRDVLDIRPFIDYTNVGISSSVQMKKKLKPCAYLWYQLLIDCEGNVLPCCMSIWKKTDPYLVLGKIEDFIPDIFRKGIKLRIRQMRNDYQNCKECPNIYRNDCTGIGLNIRQKNIKKLICGYQK